MLPEKDFGKRGYSNEGIDDSRKNRTFAKNGSNEVKIK
jgi:hypothetical protein